MGAPLELGGHNRSVHELPEGLVEVVLGEHHVAVALMPPAMIDVYRQPAELAEDFALAEESDGDRYVFVAVGDAGDWPRLVVTRQFQPSTPGFQPGILLVPHQRQLFIGAGTRLLAYHARSGRWQRSWIDDAELGFWQWRQHGRWMWLAAMWRAGVLGFCWPGQCGRCWRGRSSVVSRYSSMAWLTCQRLCVDSIQSR
jgi:hypothetical protein